MLFTLLGLVSAALFGAFFGSEGELPRAMQEGIFWALILAGAFLNAIQIVVERLCKHCHCRVCRHL